MFKKKSWSWWQYALAIVGIYIAWSLFKKGKLLGASVVETVKTSTQVAAVNGALIANGITNVRAQLVEDVAGRVYAALYKNDWFGWSEDEQAVIAAVNELASSAEAKACAAIYRELFKKNMYADISKHLSTSDLAAVKQNIYLSLKIA